MNTKSRSGGATIVEVLLTVGIVAVTGAILLTAMHAIGVSSAKNSAINLAHQQARKSINRVIEEIRESASVPRLIDANFNTLPGNGPAEGVSYQVVVAGPYRVFNNANANAPTIRVFREADKGSEKGKERTDQWNRIVRESNGLRLIVPAFQIEKDVREVLGYGGGGSASTVHNVRLDSNLGVSITCSQGVPVYPAYFTRRAALVVSGGELRYYETFPSTTYSVVARNLVDTKPFSVPGGNNRFIKFDALVRDTRISQRGYKAVDLRLSFNVPFRYQLTSRQ